jgi:hypothetical protein
MGDLPKTLLIGISPTQMTGELRIVGNSQITLLAIQHLTQRIGFLLKTISGNSRTQVLGLSSLRP